MDVVDEERASLEVVLKRYDAILDRRPPAAGRRPRTAGARARPPPGRRPVPRLRRIDTDGATIATERLRLEPLRIDDAGEMAAVLGDERLHGFIGGRPATVDELRRRYRAFVAGPADPTEAWHNWVVRTREGGVAVGTVQATVLTGPDGRRRADVAWVVGVAWQGNGYAGEAARALVDWLHRQGVDEVAAHVHPDHHASAAVARRAGLAPTAEVDADGEVVWRERGRNE